MKTDKFCELECAIGDEGHCSRSEKEYYVHCEKRFWAGVGQIGYPNGVRTPLNWQEKPG